jgi:hypothetical protein
MRIGQRISQTDEASYRKQKLASEPETQKGPELPKLYDKQRKFVEDQARYTLCEAGTKSGKTLGCACWLVKNAWTQAETIWWWIAPSYAQAMIAFELIIHGDRMNAYGNEQRGGAVGRMLRVPEQCRIRRSGPHPEIELCQGSLIQFRTAAEPDRLYGAGVAGAVIDEASRLSERAFIAIRSTLTMTRGQLKIIGNPRGTRSWFYKLCVKAKSEGEEYSYHHLCSADNPFIAPAEIEDARRILPERAFRELYLGEAQEGEGQVFTHIAQACSVSGIQQPIAGHVYVIGWDVGRKQDYSAVSVVDCSIRPLQEVRLERLSRINYELQFERVRTLSQRYFKARVLFDGTSVGGDLVGEIAEKAGISAEPFTFTSSSKCEIVNRMAATLENKEMTLQAEGLEAEIARGELELFEAKPIGNSSNVKYGAPEGSHDDTVIARCLALHAAVHPMQIPQRGIFDLITGRRVDAQ